MKNPYGIFDRYERVSKCSNRKRWSKDEKCLHGFYRSKRLDQHFAYLKEIEKCCIYPKGNIVKINIAMVSRNDFWGHGSRIKWPVFK